MVLVGYMYFKVHSAMPKKNSPWELDKLRKATHSILKIPPASGLLESHDAKDTSVLFPENICRNRWLENRIALLRGISIPIIDI